MVSDEIDSGACSPSVVSHLCLFHFRLDGITAYTCVCACVCVCVWDTYGICFMICVYILFCDHDCVDVCTSQRKADW